ncbi:MAG TPA: aspartyl protease family protein, partial [Candidatus Obscuribacterales bacterium]
MRSRLTRQLLPISIIALLALSSMVISARAQDSDTTELGDLLSKVYLAYGGKDALAALDKNYTLVGERKPRNGDGPIAHLRQVRKGACLRIDVESGENAAPVSTVYDGAAAWQSAGGAVEDLAGGRAEALSLDRDREPAVLVHYNDPGYSFKLNGRTVYRATPVFAVEVKHGENDPVIVYIGEKNFQVLGVSYAVKSDAGKPADTVTIDFSEYRPAAGTVFPFEQLQLVNDKELSELSVSSIDTTSAIDDLQFRRPDKPEQVRLAKSLTLPFAYSHKEIVVKVRINDSEPLDFLFDTGASQTVIDRAVAAENFLDKGPNYTVTAIGGNVPTQTTKIDRLYIGDVELGNVHALIHDLRPTAMQMGQRIGGIIGSDLIGRFAATIDFANEKITLNDADTFAVPAGAVVVPFAQKRGPLGGPLVRAIINGKDVACVVDTGAAFNNLPTRVAHTMLADQTPHYMQATGLDGHLVKLATLTVPTVKLSTQSVHNINFTYSVDQDLRVPAKASGGNGIVGVLGNPFWQNFALTLDYKFDRLILEPNKTQTSKQEVDSLIALGDSKLIVYRDLRPAEAAYQKALLKVQQLGDARMQARIWGRIGNLRRTLAKDLNRPEQARIAYEYFSKAHEQAHRLQDRESEGRILADWSLLYLDNGQLQAARQALQGARLLAPDDPQVNVDFAQYLYKMQQYSDMQ